MPEEREMLMPGTDGRLWPASQLKRADMRTVRLVTDLGLGITFLDEAALPQGCGTLAELCPLLDLRSALALLASNDGMARLREALGGGRVTAESILSWLRRDESAILTNAGLRAQVRGFRIGDHTVSHPYLTRLGDAAVRQEILGAARQITAVTGKSPLPLFRFPFGDADARTIAIANQAGYVPVRWTVDTLGWEGTAGRITASVVASRVLGAARPGEIILMHVGSNPDDHTTLDADALPQVISGLRAQGYSFVTLDALTG